MFLFLAQLICLYWTTRLIMKVLELCVSPLREKPTTASAETQAFGAAERERNVEWQQLLDEAEDAATE